MKHLANSIPPNRSQLATARLWAIGLTILVLLLSACGSETTPLAPNQAMLVVDMPSLKAASRALDAKGNTIPGEVTEILFHVEESNGAKVGKELDLLKVTSAQFPLAANRDYTIAGTAKAGEEILFVGRESVAPLSPGETRNITVSLLAKISLALTVSSDVQGPQSGDPSAPVQLIVGQAKEIKVTLVGLVNKQVDWRVNDISGGNAAFGTITGDGIYTPPPIVPTDPSIRIKAIPTAAPSFAAEVAVKLIPPPGDLPVPTSTATPAGGNFASPQSVILTCDVCAAIFFTLDGSQPTFVSPTYSNPIEVSVPTILKFFAVNAAGAAEATHSENYSFVVPPAAPANLTAVAADGRVTLNWTPVAGATEYHIFRSTQAGVVTTGTPLIRIATTSYNNVGLTNNATYYYKVTAANVAGDGPASAEVNARPGVLLSSITFADESLNTCFQNVLAQTNYKFAYELTELLCGEGYALSLAGIEQLVELVQVDFAYNQISDLGPLTALPALKSIILTSNQIRQVPNLSVWPHLQRLDLSGNQITDIDAIGTGNTLESLNLDNNPLESIHALATWTPQNGLRLFLNSTHLVDVIALESVPKLTEVAISNAPYLACNSVRHLDQTIDQSNGGAAGILTWSTCGNMPIRFSFANVGSRSGWRQVGLGESVNFTYVSPNPLAISWQQAPVINAVDGFLNLSRTQNWPIDFPTDPGTLWFDDVVSPDLTYEPTAQALTGLSIRVAAGQYTGKIWVQYLLDVTRRADGVRVNYREVDANDTAVFHPIAITGQWIDVRGTFGLLSDKYIINKVRLRIFGDTLGGDLNLDIDDVLLAIPLV